LIKKIEDDELNRTISEGFSPLLKRISERLFYVAFDSDFLINPDVQNAIAKITIFLASYEAQVKLLTWPEEFKGIDDYLASFKGEESSLKLQELIDNATENPFTKLERLSVGKVCDYVVKLHISDVIADIIWSRYGLSKILKITKKTFFDCIFSKEKNNKENNQEETQEGDTSIPDGMQKKNTVFENNEKTFIVKCAGKGDNLSYFALEIAAFSMRIIKEVRNDEYNISWILKIKAKDQDAQEFEVAGDDLLVLAQFREKITKRGAFLYNVTDTPTHNCFIYFVLEQSKERKKVNKTQFLGRVAGKLEYLMGNGKAIPMACQELDGLLPGKSALKITMPPSDLKEFWKEQINRFFFIYGNEAWKALGFMAATVFCDEITENDHLHCFPLLFINGNKDTGKNVLFEMVLAHFGAFREIKPFNFNSTNKAWCRQAMRYRSIPLVLNEFQCNKNNNATLTSLFDREGYIRAKTSNDLEVHMTDVNATFIIVSTRNIIGYESEAVNSRLVKVEMDSIVRDEKTWTEVLKIQENKTYLSSFISMALKLDPIDIMKKIKAEMLSLQGKLPKIEARLIMTHCIIKEFANAFLLELKLHNLAVSGIQRTIENQQLLTNNSNSGFLFLHVLKSMVERKEIPPNLARLLPISNPKTLVFKLSDNYSYVKRFISQAYEKEDLPDIKTLAKLLQSLGAKCKTSRDLVTSPDSPTCYAWYVDLEILNKLVNEEEIEKSQPRENIATQKNRTTQFNVQQNIEYNGDGEESQ